jgi:hypothetical protein
MHFVYRMRKQDVATLLYVKFNKMSCRIEIEIVKNSSVVVVVITVVVRR